MFKINALTNNIERPTWSYSTTDLPETVDTIGYFNKAWQNLERGERIDVQADFSGENLSVASFYVIRVSSDEVLVRRSGDWLNLADTDPVPDWDERELEIIAKIKKLKPDEFTMSGKPDRRILNAELGYAIEPDLLERIWSVLAVELEAA